MEGKSLMDSPVQEGASKPLDAEVNSPLAWELVDIGRYRPRRIRGSFRGRELG